MTEQVFRTPPRAAILTLGFLLGAVFFAVGAALPSASTGVKITLGAVALIFLVVAIRCARMRVVANDDEVRLYGPLLTHSVRWADMEAITAGESEVDARTFGVRTPVIVLSTGRKIKVQPVSSYSFSGNNDTPADHIAAELEALRQAGKRS